MRFWALIFLSLISVSCTTLRTEKPTCLERDWYELGRRDGSQGQNDSKLNAYKNECSKAFSTQAETLYINGRNAGLVEFCRPENGFDLGRMGIVYEHVCPAIMESEFMTAYNKGQKTRLEETEQKDFDRQVEEQSESATDSRL